MAEYLLYSTYWVPATPYIMLEECSNGIYLASYFKNNKRLMEKTVTQLPISIDPCPIEESILEIRYSSDIPNDARFGMLYGAIGKLFESKLTALPILQIPEPIRSQDPSLKYKAHHQLQSKNYLLGIGPDVLTFSARRPYTGWNNWSEFFFPILKNAFETDVISKIERVGLRYINVFDDSILKNIKCEININNIILAEESTNLRTEIIDDDFTLVLQIGNSVSMMKENQLINCSAIDIDVLHNIKNTDAFLANYEEVINTAHIKEKNLFFSLLNEPFLNKFNPNYGD
jgi:uncharacterized protein (TIGR04255 family)